MRVHAVIVNWNSAAVTEAAIRSVLAQVREVVVVDNASVDESVARFRSGIAQDPRVRIIELGTNKGFAGGSNVGMADALARGAEAVLWLNNDAELDSGCVARLAALLVAKPRAAAVTPAVLSIDGSRLFHTTCRLDPKRLRGSWQQGRIDAAPSLTGYISAEAALVRATALRDAGLFDEEFFFYNEDFEWSVRVLRRGWELWCDPSARARHHWAHSSSGKIRGYFAARNRVLLLRRHGGGSKMTVARLSFYEVRRLAWDRIRDVRRWGEVAAVFTGWYDGFRTHPARRLP